jgi:phytoene dehydrogenase-like protein
MRNGQTRAATVLARLAKELGAPTSKQHIKFEIVYQPKVWKERFNLVNGSAFGLSHNFWQVGYLRPHNRHAIQEPVFRRRIHPPRHGTAHRFAFSSLDN